MTEKNLLVFVFSVLLVLCTTAVWLLSRSFAINLTAGLLVSLAFAALIRIWKTPTSFRLWPNRASINPNMMLRLRQAEKELFLVGFSFQSLFKDYSDALVHALTQNPNLRVKILLSHPDSLHVAAHQEFSSVKIAEQIRGAVNGHLRDIYDELPSSCRSRLEVRATHYLPRFAARVFDESTMLVNFYLYRSRANENPVIELKREQHAESFAGILKSLNSLFFCGEDERLGIPNVEIVADGIWYGLPEHVREVVDCKGEPPQ